MSRLCSPAAALQEQAAASCSRLAPPSRAAPRRSRPGAAPLSARQPARRGVLVGAAPEGSSVTVTTAAAPAASPATTSYDAGEGLLELNKDTFHPFLEANADRLTVVDFYTDWCGPCKLIYPELVKLSAELAPAAQIVKVNCNQANKDLAKPLGIKVAPTFHLYRGGQKVADMTGAKVDKLRALIAEHMGAPAN